MSVGVDRPKVRVSVPHPSGRVDSVLRAPTARVAWRLRICRVSWTHAQPSEAFLYQHLHQLFDSAIRNLSAKA